MNQLPDTYALAPEAHTLARELIAHALEPGTLRRMFAHLEDARLLCLQSERTVMLRGWPVQAFVAEPRVQGPFSSLFDWLLATFAADVLATEAPDFVIMLDAAIWRSLSTRDRERLLWHELQHIIPRQDENGVEKRDRETGRISLRLQAHTFEFFKEEALQYADADDLAAAAITLADGYRRAEREKGRTA